jgi:hypothetical protein
MDRFERTVSNIALWMKISIQSEMLMHSLDGFFRYKPFFTSFIRLWRRLSAKI